LDFIHARLEILSGLCRRAYGTLKTQLLKHTQEGARHCRKPLGRRNVGTKISTTSLIF
jgi:hypothetical protein